MLTDSLDSYNKIDETREMEDLNKPIMIGTFTIIAALLIPYWLIWRIGEIGLSFLIKLAFGYLLLILAHELLHLLGYIFFGKAKISEVKLGVLWKQLTPYAHCKIPIIIKAYRVIVFLPVVLGIAPLIYAFLNGDDYWFFLGLSMTIGSLGDFIILWLLRNYPADVFVQDHPSKIGCIVYTPQS